MAASVKNKMPIKREVEFAIRDVTAEDLKASLRQYEERYGLSSEEFYEQFQRGEIAETLETVDWCMEYRVYLEVIGKLDDNA